MAMLPEPHLRHHCAVVHTALIEHRLVGGAALQHLSQMAVAGLHQADFIIRTVDLLDIGHIEIAVLQHIHPVVIAIARTGQLVAIAALLGVGRLSAPSCAKSST